MWSEHRCPAVPRRERGAALVVGLLLLLVLTVLGVAAMRSATFSERIVANEIFYHQSLQAAETAVEVTAGSVATLSAAITAGEGNKANLGAVALGYGADLPYSVTGSVNATYRGQAIATGYSLGTGGYVNHRFDIEGTGQVPGADARSVVRRGVSALGPNGS